MITTRDNVKLKRGDHAWEIGVDKYGEYRPTRGVIHGGKDTGITNPNKCWADYDACMDECKILNQD